MKNYFLLMLILASLPCFSQDNAPRFRVRVGGNYDWAIGRFADNNSADHFTAKGDFGNGVHLVTAVRIYDGLVLGIEVGTSICSQNEGVAADQLKQLYQRPGYYTTVYPGNDMTLTYFGLQAGYEFSFQKISLMPRGFIGSVTIESISGYNIYQKKKGEHYFEEHRVNLSQDSQPGNLMVGLGFTGAYQLFKKFSLIGGLNYYTGKTRISATDYVSSFMGSYTQSESSFSQPVSFLQLEIGIELRVGKH